MDTIQLLHANANTLIRAGLKSVLLQKDGVEEIHEAEDREDLFELLENQKIDVLIIDHNAPSCFSDQDIITVRKKYPFVNILIISSEKNHPKILSILETGGQGYLTRECDEDEIINAIFCIAKGEKFYCNKVIYVIL